MSEAFGNITIFCASFDALVDLIQCHLKYEKEAYYSTSLDLFEDVSPENRTEIIKIVEENYELDSTTHDAMLVSDFTAIGRWSFNSNIGWFFGCLTEDYSKQLKQYLILFKICWIITSMILERLYLLNGC